MPHEPTAKDVLRRDGTSRLMRFRGRAGGGSLERAPLLLVPSLINRWYVLDLRRGVSLAAALVEAGIDTWVLDWGVAEDEDRYLSWDDVLARLDRAARFMQRNTGAPRIGMLGYCMGATLASIWSALNPTRTAALVDLLGPVDFAHGGLLRTMVDATAFDVATLTAAGNVSPFLVQAGFGAMRPTQSLAKIVGLLDRGHDPAARLAFDSLEEWANDNVPFPAAAFRTYVDELYQRNLLVQGEHRVGGRRVDLGAITAPTLVVAAERDTICPPDAARALLDHVRGPVRDALVVPGGHVGAVISPRAATTLYPALVRWLDRHLDTTTDARAEAETPAWS